MKYATITYPAESAMQSGAAKNKPWLFAALPAHNARFGDPLMGWTGATDTRTQLKLRFRTEEEAVRYAETHGYAYTIHYPRAKKRKPKSYASNFS